MAELGLRYRPTSGADFEAHRARLTLLAENLADAPADLLRVAIIDHARTCRFMPTAAELVALMQTALDTRDAAAATADEREWAASFVGRRNVDLAIGASGRSDIEWYRDAGGDPRLRPRPAPELEVAPIAPELVDERNAALARFGAPFRYDPAGKPMRAASSGH